MKRVYETRRVVRLGFLPRWREIWASSLFFKGKPSFDGLRPAGWRSVASLALIFGMTVLIVGGILRSLSGDADAVTAGPRTATASSDCTDNSGTGTVTWTNPGNAAALDSTSATASITKNGGVSHYILCQNFGFTSAMIPSGATINGITVSVTRSANSTSSIHDSAVRLVKAGVIGTTDRSTSTLWPTSLTNEDHGSSTDLWGTTWSPTDITASNFGVAFAATNTVTNQAKTASVDAIQVTVDYSVPTTLTQRHYIFQKDDGANVNSNSAYGTADTALTNVHKGERLTARIQVDNTNVGDFTNGQFKLQYDKNDNNWTDVASWTDIRPGYGTSGSNGDALTSAAAGTCTSGTTFSNGTWQEGVSASTATTLAANKCSEVAFMIDTRNAALGTTYRLRLYDMTDNKVLNSYSVYPTLTVIAAASESIRAGKNDEIQMPACSDSSWECQMVESSGNKGQDTSLAFAPDGTPWISYRDGDNSALKVAQYVGSGGTGCDSTAWTCSTIYTGVVQRHTSLAFDKAGVPWIAYTELYSTNGYISYAKYVGSGGNCTSTAWSCTRVDQVSTGTPAESFLSLDFSPTNQAAISYYSAVTPAGLKVAMNVGGTGSGNCVGSTGWSCTDIDSSSSSGKYNSLHYDHSGTPWISYSSSTSSLEVAQYVGTGGSGCTGSTAWTCENIDGNGTTQMGDFSSVIFDNSNTPWVSYHDKTTLTLKIAQRVGSGGTGCSTSSAWTCTTIDDPATGDAGWYTSLAINQANQPIVASTTYASSVGTLRFARYVGSGGTGCSNTAWSCTSVDTSASTGVYASLALSPSGTPWVVYFSDVNLDLRVAKLALPSSPTYMRYGLNTKGFSDVASYDTNSDSLAASANIPMYRFDMISASNTNAFYPSWVGQSSTAASSAAIKLQVYQYGTTNAWVDLVTNSSCAANADCSLTASSVATNLSQYYESLGSTYALHFRVYQAAGSSTTFKTNVFTVTSGSNASLTQADYRWYANTDSIAPGSALAGQDLAGVLSSSSPAVRLRTNIGAATANLPAGAAQLKLQYATSTGGPWTDVGGSSDWCNATTGVTCNTSWGSRRKITLDNSASSENLTNFPVMIRLDSTRIDYSKTQNAGQDLRFVDPSDPTTVLPYEIEKWDETGSSYVWVKVPQIDANSNTDYIWMYYNNASAADGQAASSVWSNNYGAVWHLSETSGQHNDSSGNGNTSSSVSVTTQGSATGKIDGADAKTNASTQSIQFPSSTSNAPSGNFTVEAWVKADVESPMSNFRTIINKESASTNRTYWLTIWDNAMSASCPDRVAAFSAAIAGAAVYACGTTPIADGNWHHVAGVYDGSNLRVFVDGTQEGSTAVSGALGTNSGAVWVGNVSTNTARSFGGTLDEVRESNTNRSAAWMAAEYKSENDTFASFGPEGAPSSGGWGFYDNASVSDGAGISTLLSTSNAAESYEENNPTVPNTSAITVGQNGEWDFALDPSSATLNTAYYFRLVNQDGSALAGYTNYPQITVSSTGSPPSAPSSTDQIKVTGGISIAVGGWTNENQIKLTASVSDPDPSDTLQLCVEQQPLGTAFTNTETACGTGVAYSGTPVTASVTIGSLPEGEYHWQARAKDAAGNHSSWVSFGANAESARDFGVDISAPTGTVYDGSSTGVEQVYNDGSLTDLSANWTVDSTISGLATSEYSIGTTPGGTDVATWTTASGTTAAVTGLTLSTSQPYYFNVRSTDNAGNQSVISSNGQMVSPSLGFSVSTSTVTFDSLNAANSYTSTKNVGLTITTNARNGYQVHASATQDLTNQASRVIGMFSGGTYAAPAAWAGGMTGFGYTSSDTSVGGSNRFNSATCPGGGAAPCYAPYNKTLPGDVIVDGSGPATVGDSYTINNRVTVTPQQAAGKYSTTLTYSANAIY